MKQDIVTALPNPLLKCFQRHILAYRLSFETAYHRPAAILFPTENRKTGKFALCHSSLFELMTVGKLPLRRITATYRT